MAAARASFQNWQRFALYARIPCAPTAIWLGAAMSAPLRLWPEQPTRSGPTTAPDRSAAGAVGEFPIPYDTSLTVRRTREVLNYEPPGIRELLNRFRHERSTGALAAA